MISNSSSQFSRNKYQKIRRDTRIFLVQCFYAWDFSQNSAAAVISSVREGLIHFGETRPNDPPYFGEIDEIYFRAIFDQFIKNIVKIDEILTPCLSRTMEALGAVERAILRLAVLELSEVFSVPNKVVINEAIELSKNFGATESFKFINGALHALTNKKPFYL